MTVSGARCAIGIGFVAAVGTMCGPVQAENWPAWRGPTGDGVVANQALPTRWSKTQNVRWRAPIPGWGNSTPVVWNERIFLTTQVDADLVALCLDGSTGKVLWQRPVGQGTARREGPAGSAKFHQLHNLASPSAVVDGTHVVFHFGDGTLVSFDLDGGKLWSRNLTADYGPYTIWWGHANSPVRFGDLVISACMQDPANGGKSYLVAHDVRTGEVRWHLERDTGATSESADAYTTPVLYEQGGRTELIVMGGNVLDAYDPASGKRLWHCGGLEGGRTVTGPTVGGGLAFVTCGKKGPMAAVCTGGAGDVTQSHLAWTITDTTTDTPCPVYADGLLFFPTDNGIALCLDAKTGTEQWKQRLGGDFKASPIVADGKVYFLNKAGTTFVVDASRRYRLAAENRLQEETLASPAVAGSDLLLRTKQAVYRVGGR